MSKRRLLGLAVLGAWLCVVGWHVRREYFITASDRLAAGARTLAPGSHWYVIRMDSMAIGIALSRLDTLPDTIPYDGFVFTDEITLDIPALGRIQRSQASTRIDLGPALELRKFRFALDSEIGRFGVSGEVQPDSTIALEMNAGAGTEQTRVQVSQELLLDAALTLRMAASGALRVGNEFVARIFDPSSMSERAVNVRVTADSTFIVADSAQFVNGRWVATLLDTVPVYRVEQRFGGVSIANWVDEDGQIVKAESPLGFTIERTYYELARQEWQAGRSSKMAAGYGALIEGTAISSNVALNDLESRDRLRVRLRGVDLEGFDLDGERQVLRGDTLDVSRHRFNGVFYTLPFRGDTTERKRRIMQELQPTLLIQSDDPRIIEAAKRIAEGSSDPNVVAQKINEWVYRTLRKDITPSVPSAVQVLEAKRGDCNEHTVLYVALARALGLPARTAVGLVYVRGSFYYHAWPEVYIDGWVAVDPTLGQFPADASHLRFLVGGLARQVELIRLIGRLQLEVL